MRRVSRKRRRKKRRTRRRWRRRGYHLKFTLEAKHINIKVLTVHMAVNQAFFRFLR